VQQYWLGLPADKLARSAETAGLKDWWEDFLNYDFKVADCKIYPELVLSMQMGKHRLIAKYDLVAVGPDKIYIFDWKTNQKRPREEAMAGDYQTRVYRSLMVNAGGYLMNSRDAVQPELVEMVYWFVNFPNQPIRLPYTTAQSERDAQHLSHLIAHIESEESFPLTADENKCKFCLYRSYCDRGISAPELDDENLLQTDMPTLDLEQVSEIEY
jgi:CRISPR/Cas system-associated exonuclease Cas4 (RecB family)